MKMVSAAMLALAIGLLPTQIAFADDAARRGQMVVNQWCRGCHLRPTDQADADMAPPFEAIVQRSGRDRGYFEKFLWEDHFPMPTYRLFDYEKRDVVAYLMALQEAD